MSNAFDKSRKRDNVTSQARIQLLAKGEVVKIMENKILLPQAANVSDRMPQKRVPHPTKVRFMKK